MQNKNRPAIVISALLTTLVMTLIAGGLFAYNGLLPLPGVNAQGEANPMLQPEAPIVVTVQPVLVPAQEQAAQEAPAAAATVNNEAITMQSPDAVAGQSAINAEVVAAYQAQLDEAYKALQEAYTQIDALQTAQAQSASAPTYAGDDDDEHDRRTLFHFSDDSREGGEREHDDD